MRESYNFFKQYYKCKLKIYIYIACSILEKVCMLMIPYLTKVLIDQIQLQNLDMFKNMVFALVLVMALFSVFLASEYYLQNYIEVKILNLLKKDMITKILKIRNEKVKSITTGEVIQKVFNDTEVVKPLIISTYVECIINAVYSCSIVVIMFTMNKLITIILLILFPIFFVFYKIYVPKIEKANKNIIKADEDLKSLTEEVLTGCLDIKVNNADAFINSKVKFGFGYYFKYFLGKIKYVMLYDYVLVTGIMNFATLSIYCFGGYLVFKSIISIGTLTSFVLYFSRIWDPVEYFMELSKELKIQLISLNRIKEFFNMENEERIPGVSLPQFKKLTVNNLKFSYEDRAIFENLSFEAEAGDLIGIKGENGSGKSTFSNLIIKLLDGYEGDIYYNDLNYNKIDSVGIREKIRYIPGKTFLFSGSIIENITLDSKSTKEDIRRFIKESQSEELISILEKNKRDFETIVSDNSNNLSGGEQKIIEILRGLFVSGDVFILDEPFNYIDKKHKQILIDFIRNNLKLKAVIIISHDEDIFKYCNKIYKIDKDMQRIK